MGKSLLVGYCTNIVYLHNYMLFWFRRSIQSYIVNEIIARVIICSLLEKWLGFHFAFRENLDSKFIL